MTVKLCVAIIDFFTVPGNRLLLARFELNDSRLF